MLENIVGAPAQVQNHSTAPSWLTIDLNAIVENYQTIRAQLSPQADIAGVVKANGYGLGAEKIAQTLYNCSARRFFVATMDEALNLRSQLPEDTAIAMLCGLLPDAESLYLEQHITPVLNSLDEILRWNRACNLIGERRPAMIHFDTGMNRLGLGPDETYEFLERNIDVVDGFECAGIMSHFACADEVDNPMTREQYERFQSIANHFPDVPKSLANSSGVFRSNDYHYDIIRPGMAICGLNPTPETNSPMKNVVTLETRILQIRNVRKGDTSGYGATYRFDKEGRQATVSLGYADGFLRHLGDQASLYFNGKRCKITGRVSMDLITVDITNATTPDAMPPKVGDAMEVLGPNQNADTLADSGGTIGYEVLTSLGFRYHRQYLEAMTNLGPRYERRYIE